MRSAIRALTRLQSGLRAGGRTARSRARDPVSGVRSWTVVEPVERCHSWIYSLGQELRNIAGGRCLMKQLVVDPLARFDRVRCFEFTEPCPFHTVRVSDLRIELLEGRLVHDPGR